MILFGLFFVLTINVLAQNPDLTQARTGIEKMNKEFDQAMLSKDFNKIGNFFTDDALSLPSYSPEIKGKDAIVEEQKKDFASNKYNAFTTNTTDVYGSGDLIYEIGTYAVNFTMANAPNPIDDHGKYVNIWQKQGDGSWKIKVQTWNSDMNPMMMNQAGAKSKEDSTGK
jgi:ketosteroid isomerase-like protein